MLTRDVFCLNGCLNGTSGNSAAALQCDPSLDNLELGPNGVVSCQAVYEVR